MDTRALILLGVTALSGGASAAPAGEAIYQSTCIACHGPDGTGVLPGVPDLTAREGPLALDDEVLLGRIAQGYQSPGSPMAMPPRGGNPALTDEDLRAVLRYLRGEFMRR